MSWFPRPSARAPRSATSRRSCASEPRAGDRRRARRAGDVIIVIEFVVDSKINTAPPPQIVYVELYPSNRTDAEIIADQKKDQAAREAARERAATAIPEAREAARHVSGDDRALHGRGGAARRSGARAKRAQSQCRLRHRLADGEIVGRGATAPGGRPHAEAVALEQAGAKARRRDLYVTLEPCAHDSERGPACADLLLEAKPARVVIALKDPDPRTAARASSGFATPGSR